jgi:hypothetical protein
LHEVICSSLTANGENCKIYLLQLQNFDRRECIFRNWA